MIPQIILNTHSQKTDQKYTMVGNEAKNPLPTIANEINAMDLVGLSWIFTKEYDFE